MKTFETEKHSIPEGATHYWNETLEDFFAWWDDANKLMLTPDGNGAWESVYDKSGNEPTPIPQTNIETPEEKEALDLIDTTPHQYEMSKFSGKQRTKVEYVKCEFIKLSDAAKAVDGGDIQFNKFGNQPINDMALALHYYNNGTLSFYRRIETTMTEREEFIESVRSIGIAFFDGSKLTDSNIEHLAKEIYDSGKFKLVELK